MTAQLFAEIIAAQKPEKKSVTRPFTVAKADPDQRLVFGWASVATRHGEPLIDAQGDIIPPEEMERAAYDFALHYRDQGVMHEKTGVGRMVESIVFTKEKQAALGIDLGLEGWWIGFKVDDEGVWQAYKRGELPDFSIGGTAIPQEI